MNEWIGLAITAASCAATILVTARTVRVAQREADTGDREADTHQSAMVAEAAVALLAPYRAELAARDYRIAELTARVEHLEHVITEAGLDIPAQGPHRRQAP